MHIGNLVPHERYNFACMLESSGVVKRVKKPLENICENLTHLHKLVEHLGVITFVKGVEEMEEKCSLRSIGQRWRMHRTNLCLVLLLTLGA